MFLSIVIPTYNRANFIEQTLNFVLAQDCDDYEVIVVDDGSTDNTTEIVLPFLSEKVRYLKITNSERGAARNRGTEMARGEYVNWFDSDDEMLPNHVSELKRLQEISNTTEVLTTLLAIKDKENKILPIKHTFSILQLKRKHFLVEGNYLACNSICVRKDIALQNPFIEDRKLSASEDYELWLRLMAKYPFHASNCVTSYLIQHDQRSVNTMTDADKIETRFLSFLQYIKSNLELKTFLGNDFNYLLMKNYLLLALELANCGHKSKSKMYLKTSLSFSKVVFLKRWFWATVKHLIIK